MKPHDIIYLDHAAATPLDDRVFEAMQPYFRELFFNPSSPYLPAVQVRRDYEAAKQRLAMTFGAKGDEIVMTAGATESINLAFHSTSGHVVTSAIEHPAVLAAAKQRQHTLVEVDEDGRVSPEAVMRAVTDQTELVSIGLANSELGTVQPLRRIAAALEEVRKQRQASGNNTPLYLHSDASQGFGQLDIHVARLGVDLLTLNAAKIYGPKQVGLLWARRHATVKPHVVGGGQERGLRSGTENVAGVMGFAMAAELATQRRPAEAPRLTELRDSCQRTLVEALPDSVLSGAKKHRLPGHLHIAFPGVDAERLVFLLEAQGVLVATGSACAANKQTRSHVLAAIGLSDQLINGSLRITLGQSTTSEQLGTASRLIIEAVQSEHKRTGR